MFIDSEKYYLPYLSDDQTNDQHFVDSVLLLEDKDLHANVYTMMEETPVQCRTTCTSLQIPATAGQ